MTRLRLVLGGCLLLAADVGAAPPTVAVLDFTVADDATVQAAGVADCMELALAARDTRVVERRVIRAVLAERRLDSLLRDEDRWRQGAAMLDADLLLTGALDMPVAGDFRLRLTLMRSRDAVEVARREVTGQWPGDLLTKIDEAADALVPRLRDDNDRAAHPPRRMPGFTENPEAALFYYQGLEHLGRDRLPEAIAHLREAWRRDKTFALAKAWQMRALRRAGLPDFADAVAQDMMREGRDEAALAELTRARGDSDRMVVLLVSAPDAQDAHDNWARLLADAPGIDVLAASRIDAATSERDLKLSGLFERLPTAVDRWLFTDVMLRVDLQSATLSDAVTGRTLCVLPTDPPRDPAQTLLEAWRAGDAGRNEARRADDAGRNEARRADDWLDAPITASPTGTTFYSIATVHRHVDEPTVQITPGSELYQHTMVMRRLTDSPNDLANLWAAAALWDASCTPPALERMIRLIERHRDAPRAAAWLSTALYYRGRWIARNNPFPALGYDAEPSVTECYRVLLEWFPDSSEARLVEYGQAHEMLLQDRRHDALALLEPLARDLPTLRFVDDVQPTRNLRVSLPFYVARTYFELGDAASARPWLDQCLQVHRQRPSQVYPVRVSSMHAEQNEVRWHLCSRVQLSERIYHDQCLEDMNDLRPQIAALEARLAAVEAGEARAGPYRDWTRLFLDWLEEADPDARFALLLDSVREYVREHPPKASVPEQVVQQVAWLRSHCRDQEQLQHVRGVIADLLALTHVTRTRLELHKLDGRFGEADRTIRDLLLHPSMSTRMIGIFEQVEMDSLRLGLDDQADRLLENVRALERDFAEQIASLSIEYCTLIELVGPILVDLGRPLEAIDRYRRIVDDLRVPAFYRDRVNFRMGIALARSGDVAGGVGLLREVVERTARRDADTVTWDVPTATRRQVDRLRDLWPQTPAELAWAAQENLHRLRLYGGRPVAMHAGSAVTLPHLPVLPEHQLAELYALALNLSWPTSYRDRNGQNYWSDEGYYELLRRGAEARDMVHRLLWVQTCTGSHSTPDQTRRAAWRSLAAVSELPALMQPPRDVLLDWLIWSPVCEIKSIASYSLDKLGRADGQVVASLVMGSAAVGGCEHSARAALRKVSDSAPDTAVMLAQLLDHPMLGVRQYAGQTLARLVGLTLDLDRNGLPSTGAIQSLSTWWSEAGDDPALWPARRWDDQPGHRGLINHVAISADARTMLSVGAGATAWVWDLEGDRRPVALRHDQVAWVRGGCLSTDGRLAVTVAQDDRLRIWDLARPGRPPVISELLLNVYNLALDPDAHRLATDLADRVAIRDTTDGRIVQTFEKPGGWTEKLAFSPDGSLLAAGGDRNGRVVVFNLRTGERRLLHPRHAAPVQSMSWLNDRTLMTVSTDRTARLWDVNDGLEIARFNHDGYLRCSAASSDRRWIATGDDSGRVWLWDLATHQNVRRIELGDVESCVQAVAFTATGRLWAVTDRGVASLIDPHNSDVVRTFRISPDPAQMPRLARSGQLLWPQAQHQPEGDSHEPDPTPRRHLAARPSHILVYSGSVDGCCGARADDRLAR